MKYSRAKTKKCRKKTSDLDLVLVHTREDNENAIGLLSKTTSLHVHHAFLYISLPLLHDYDVKMPSFTFYGGRKTSDDKLFFLFLNLSVVPKKSTPVKLAYISYFQRIEINAINLEKTLIHIESDVFADVTFVDAKSP